MAKLEVSTQFLEELLFCGADAQIVGIDWQGSSNPFIVLYIEGPDVPDAEQITALCRLETSHDDLVPRETRTMTFEAAKPLKFAPLPPIVSVD